MVNKDQNLPKGPSWENIVVLAVMRLGMLWLQIGRE